MTKKRILVLFMLVALLSGTAAQAFPLFGSSNYYSGYNNGLGYSNGSGYNNGSRCRRHHNHHRHHKMW